MTNQTETPLETAQRYVAEGEARWAQQIEHLLELIINQSEETEEVWLRLRTLKVALDFLREKLRCEEKRAAAA
jgi:hypothetical protein